MFVASDVAKASGYKGPKQAIAKHCVLGKESNHTIAYLLHSNGIGGTNAIIIGEKNIYRLIMRSNLPSAIKFQDWVCDEVLPAIRKDGGYYQE